MSRVQVILNEEQNTFDRLVPATRLTGFHDVVSFITIIGVFFKKKGGL